MAGVMATLQTVLGLPRWEAAGRAAEAGWLEEAQPLWDRFARRVTRPRTLLDALDQVAQGSPRIADLWLCQWLAGRTLPGDLNLSGRAWPRALPEHLTLRGILALPLSPVTALPRHLTVGSELWLDRSRLRALPEALTVGGSLRLRGCPDWDGLIPGDARIGGRVVTDPHPHGVSLQEWRARYPLGERPDLRGAH